MKKRRGVVGVVGVVGGAGGALVVVVVVLHAFLICFATAHNYDNYDDDLATLHEEQEEDREINHKKLIRGLQTIALLSEDVYKQIDSTLSHFRTYLVHPLSAKGVASLFAKNDPSTRERTEEYKEESSIEIGRPPLGDKFQFRTSGSSSTTKNERPKTFTSSFTSSFTSAATQSRTVQKRDNSEENNNTTTKPVVVQINDCSNVGVTIKANNATNYCIGGCKIKQTVCSQALGYENPIYVDPNIKYCRVTKVLCGGTEELIFDSEAYPVKLNCGGTIEDPTSSNLYSCNVNQILYRGALLNFTTTPEINCHIDTLRCDGKKVNMLPYIPYIPSQSEHCVLSSSSCVDTQRCSSITWICSSDNSSECAFLRIFCDDPCWQQQCICPIDTTGDDCSDQRSFKCSLSLLHPSPNCSQPQGLSKLTDSDGLCFQYSVEDTISFLFNISCYFTSLDSITALSSTYPFHYTIRNGDVFALTSANIASGLSFDFHPFNLKYYLTESTATISTPITPSQLIGNETLQIVFSPKANLFDLPNAREFMMGGRTYIECSANIPSRGLESPIVYRLFLDYTDKDLHKGETPNKYYISNGNTLALLIISSILGITFIAYVVSEIGDFLKKTKKIVEKTKGKKVR